MTSAARKAAVRETATTLCAIDKMVDEWTSLADTTAPSTMTADQIEATRMTLDELILRARAASLALRELKSTLDPDAQRPYKTTVVTITLAFTGSARDEAASDLDNVLDNGTFQEAIAEYAADHDHDYELISALVTETGEELRRDLRRDR